MSDEWQNGWNAGYEAGYSAGYSDNKKVKPTQIHDPGDIDKIYEEAYGAALYNKMKKVHDKF